MSTLARITSIATVILLLSATAILAQVEIDPPRPVLSSRLRSLEMTVKNPTSKPLEVTVEFLYTVIRSDSTGAEMLADSNLTSTETTRNCSSWLKVFPRKFTIQPQSTRSVRLLAAIPGTAEDGEYWSRIVFNTNQRDIKPIELNDSADVQLNVGMQLAVGLPVLVRVGKIETGVDVATVIPTAVDSGKMGLLCDLSRSGNSPYRGTVLAQLKGAAADSAIAKGWKEVTVEWNHRALVRIPTVEDGSYRLELTAIPIRGGSMKSIVVPARQVHQVYDVSVTNGALVLNQRIE